MNKKLLITFGIMFLLSLNLVSASLGCFKQNDAIPIVTNLLANNVTITQITSPTPNPEILIQNELMDKNGNSYNWSFTGTNKTGVYTYGYCDDVGNCYGNSFEVTPSGYCGGTSIAFFIMVIILIYAITFVGYFKREVTIALLGSMACIILGVYLFNNGVIIFRDDITRVLSYLTLGLGFAISLIIGISYIQENM